MVNTRLTVRDVEEPNNMKVSVTKKKVVRTPKIIIPPPDPSSAKGNKAAVDNSVIINCTYEGHIYVLIGFRDNAISIVFSLLMECIGNENIQDLKGFPETSEGLSYVSDGSRVSRFKKLGAFPTRYLHTLKKDAIDIVAQTTILLDTFGSEPSYSGGSSSSDSDDDKDMGTQEDDV